MQGNRIESKDGYKKVNESEEKGYEDNSKDKDDPNFLGQNVAKLLILCELPKACIEKFKVQ